MKFCLMEKLRKLRKFTEKNKIKEKINFLKVFDDEQYRHSMDELDSKSKKINKNCKKAKEIIEMQWWRLIQKENLDQDSKKIIISDLQNCKEQINKSAQDFENEIDAMIKRIS